MDEDDQKQTAVILNPIEERDQTILEQNQIIENLKDSEAASGSLKTELEKIKIENLMIKKKLTYTRKATEQRICENISSSDNYREDPLLVAVLSATLNEDEIDIEEKEAQEYPTDEHMSRKELFMLSSLDSGIDKTDDIQQERLLCFKNQVFEKVKATKISRSSSSKRRYSWLGTESSTPARSTSRPRMASPPALPQL